MATNQNMALWDSVQTTDKAYTKTADLDGRSVTSINGTYVARRLTETFGPIGKGWGFDILEDRFDNGAPIWAGTKDDRRIVAHEVMHTIKLKAWYLRGGKKNYITHYGHTPFVRNSKYGPYTDFDAPKKSVTDAIKKAFSLAGFSADIHMGMFDDPTYLFGLELQKRLDEASESGKQEVMDEAKAAFRAWVETQIEVIAATNNQRSLEAMRKTICEKAREKAKVVNYDPADVEHRINEAADERLQYLNDKYPTGK